MSGAGDLNARVRRPSVAGQNTWIIYNSGGVEGASPNLTFNAASNTFNVFMLNASANIANTGNLLVTQNTFTGNLSVTTLANIATLNVSVNCNVAALNIGGLTNTITLNVSSSANISTGNIATANIPTLLSPNTWTYLNGTSSVSTANQNFNNTATIQPVITANGSQANIGFNQFQSSVVLAASRAIALTDAFGVIYQNSATSFGVYLPTQSNVLMPIFSRVDIIVGRAGANVNVSPNSNVVLLTVNAAANILSQNTVAQTGNMNLQANSISTLWLVEPFANVWMLRTSD